MNPIFIIVLSLRKVEQSSWWNNQLWYNPHGTIDWETCRVAHPQIRTNFMKQSIVIRTSWNNWLWNLSYRSSAKKNEATSWNNPLRSLSRRHSWIFMIVLSFIGSTNPLKQLTVGRMVKTKLKAMQQLARSSTKYSQEHTRNCYGTQTFIKCRNKIMVGSSNVWFENAPKEMMERAVWIRKLKITNHHLKRETLDSISRLIRLRRVI